MRWRTMDRGKQSCGDVLASILGSTLLLSIMAAPGLWYTYLALSEWPIHLFGETTEATIIGQHKSYAEDLVSYYLEYQYQVNGSHHIRSSEEVSISLYTHRGPGDTIIIRYLPLFPPLLPTISRIEGNTFQRNYLSAWSCWLNVFVFQLVLLIFASTRPPTTTLARKRISIAFTGGCAMLVVTIGAWLAELAVLASLGVYRGVAGLGVGLLAGLIAALFAWRPWQARPD